MNPRAHHLNSTVLLLLVLELEVRCGDARRLLQGCSCEGPRPYMRSHTGYGQLFTFKLTRVEGLSSKARCVSLEANP